MKASKIIQALAVCAGVALGLRANAGYIKTQATVEPGKWTSDYYGGLDYAEKNNIPAFVFWANAGCGHCEAAEKQMNEEPFLSWMTERKLVMIFTEADSKVKSWIKKNARKAIKKFPYGAVYWPENTEGELVLEGFSAYKGEMSAYGASSKDSNAQQIMDAVDFLLPDWDPSGVKPVEPDPPPTPGHVHEWSAWAVTKAATCTADGEQTRTCSAPDCPNAVETQVIKALGHDWGAWEIVTPAAVGVEGQKRRACKRCTATETAVIPAIDPEPERKEVDASVVYKNGVKSLSGIVYEDGDLVGTASLSIGKYSSKKRTVKATLKISLFAGSSASASATVTPNEYGDLKGAFNFKSKYGDAMEFALVYNDGEFELVAENELYSVELGSVNIGGKLETEEMMFSAEMDYELPEDYDYVVDVPMGEPVYVKNGTKFSFDKAPSIKYKKFSEDGWKWYELVGLDDEVKTNVNALKLSYKSKTGAFTGSFKVYASNEMSVDEDKKPTLKSYTVKVSGVIVDGEGFGTLKIGNKVVGSCTLD